MDLEKKKKTGLITSEVVTTNRIESSVIDFVIVSKSLVKHIDSRHIYDRRMHVLTKNQKPKVAQLSVKVIKIS